MHEKRWRDYEMTVNGLPQRIRYNADTVEGMFLPLLRRLTEMQRAAARRILHATMERLTSFQAASDEHQGYLKRNPKTETYIDLARLRELVQL